MTAKGEPVDQNEGRTSTNGIYVTDANGQFTITGLQPGAYVVSETKAPDGYVLDTTPHGVFCQGDNIHECNIFCLSGRILESSKMESAQCKVR